MYCECGIGQIDGKLGAHTHNDAWARVNDSMGATQFPKNISHNALQEKPLLLTFCTRIYRLAARYYTIDSTFRIQFESNWLKIECDDMNQICRFN